MSRLSALLLLVLASPAPALDTMFVTKVLDSGASKSIEVVRGQALVRYSSSSTPGYGAQVAAGGGILSTELGLGWALVELPAGMGPDQGVTWLKSMPGTLDAQYNHAYRTNRVPNDPSYLSQYGLNQINAPAAWDYEVGTSSRVTVAVVDSGIDGVHADLSGKLTNTVSISFDATTGAPSANNPPTAECNHGTRVAGIAAATSDNATDIAGVSWGAQLVSLKVFQGCGGATADCNCSTSDTALIRAINFSTGVHNTAAYGRMVVNMSLGGGGACGGALQTAVSNAVGLGVVIIAASGNDGGAVNSPGNCAGIIPVGATNSSGDVATFSSRGPELASGGLVAPGVSVMSTTPGGGTASGFSGTSFSAPHVAGAAALIMAAKPAYTPAQVLATLRGSSDNVGLGTLGGGFKTAGNVAGAGRLNAFAAMRLAITGQLADFQGEDKVVAFPNPFRADRHQNVTFAFPPSLQGSTDVTIKIYTMDGALVRDLRSLTWNLKNEHGRNVASGTYLYVVATSQGKKTGRISVIR